MVADANFRKFLVLRLGRWRQARLRLRRGWGQAKIPPAERHKIDSAERFFKALQQESVPVRFETKINRERLGDLISAIVNK